MKQAKVWTISLVILGLLVALLYWWQLESRKGPPNAASAPAASMPVAAAPIAEPASAIRPPLELAAPVAPAAAAKASEAKAPATLVEALTEALGDKALLQWLNVDAFAHRVAVTVDSLARAHSPARFWPVHPTPGRFATLTTGDAEMIAFANAKRYAAFVGWVESLETKQVIALYRLLYPQFQRAYENLGYPGRPFNDRVIAVIDHLLDTPAVPEPIEVKLANVKGPIQPTRPWVMVEFADPEIEERTSGQKLMLRIGKDNARRLKGKLTALRALLTQPR
ncbi:MAG: DUF3014 domain-containing protein [Burkholderiaceae bacterium]